MGKGISKSADLAPFTEWERKSVDDLLQKYKDEDLPFGLSEKQATTLLTDEALVKKVFNFFAGSEKTLSALEMLCSVALLATGSVEERKASLFTAFDFNKVGKICSAELVIMVICVVKAYMSVLVGNVKTAEDAMVAKDVEQGIEEIVNNKFGVDGEDITLESFNEFVVEEFDQPAFHCETEQDHHRHCKQNSDWDGPFHNGLTCRHAEPVLDIKRVDFEGIAEEIQSGFIHDFMRSRQYLGCDDSAERAEHEQRTMREVHNT